MSYTRKVAFNTIAQFAGKIIGIGIALVTIGILFRFLGVEGAGKYTTVFAFTSFFALFADIGLGWTMLRELSVEKDQNKVFQNIFTMRLILGIFIYAVAALVIWLFAYTPDVKMSVGILSIAWFFQSLTSNAVQIYLNKYRMDIAVLAEVVGKACILLVVYLISIHGGSLMSVMGAYLAGCFVNFVIVWSLAGKFVKTGLAFDFVYWRYALRQALPIGITLVFGYVYYKVDSLMLSWIQGMTDVGIYGAPYKLLEVLQMFPALFLGSAFSLVTRYVANKDERLNSAFQKQFDFLSLIAVPIVIGTFILALPIITFITGSGGEFTTSSTVTLFGREMTSITCLKILIFSVGVNFFSTLYNFMIVSLGKQKQMILPTICFALINIILNLILIPRYSYIGASVSTLFTEALVLIATYYVSRRNIILPLRFNVFGKVLLSGIVMGLSCWGVYYYSGGLILTLLVAIVVYAIMVTVLKALPINTLKNIFKANQSETS
ncbi:MAG: flippase [bacterium]